MAYTPYGITVKVIPVADDGVWLVSTGKRNVYIYRRHPEEWEAHTLAGRINGWTNESLIYTYPSQGDAIQSIKEWD